jgi:hypothetical protein
MKVILYHPTHPKECDQPSQGDNFGGISRMLSTTKKEMYRVPWGLF